MSDTVVDSSVVVKWILAEVASAQAQRLLDEFALKSERLIVLDLALVEVGNAIWKQHHRKRISAEQVGIYLDFLLRLPIHVEPCRRFLPRAVEIAIQYDRAVYDALFVALAESLGLPGVTADEVLYGAVRTAFPGIVRLRDWS